MVDIVSEARLILGLGLGYRQEEFDGFGVSLRDRKGRMEEGIEILKKTGKAKRVALKEDTIKLKT